MELDILMGAFVGLKYARTSSFADLFNLLISLVCISFYATLTVVVIIKILLFNKKPKDNIEETHWERKIAKWKGLYEGLNTKVSFASYVVALNVVKDFVISSFIILAVENSKLQLIPTILFITLTGVFVMIKKPFDSCLANWTIIINNFAYTSVLVIFYMIENNSSDMTQKERHTKLGFPCVIIICIILVINLIIGIATMVVMIREACKKMRSAKRSKVSGVSAKIKKLTLNDHHQRV